MRKGWSNRLFKAVRGWWGRWDTAEELAPGQSARVKFVLDARSLSYWDSDSHGWKVAPGTYALYAAASSRDIRLSGSFIIQ